jgi:hypothetical protein
MIQLTSNTSVSEINNTLLVLHYIIDRLSGQFPIADVSLKIDDRCQVQVGLEYDIMEGPAFPTRVILVVLCQQMLVVAL